jgi:hypothetical protein
MRYSPDFESQVINQSKKMLPGSPREISFHDWVAWEDDLWDRYRSLWPRLARRISANRKKGSRKLPPGFQFKAVHPRAGGIKLGTVFRWHKGNIIRADDTASSWKNLDVGYQSAGTAEYHAMVEGEIINKLFEKGSDKPQLSIETRPGATTSYSMRMSVENALFARLSVEQLKEINRKVKQSPSYDPTGWYYVLDRMVIAPSVSYVLSTTALKAMHAEQKAMDLVNTRDDVALYHTGGISVTKKLKQPHVVNVGFVFLGALYKTGKRRFGYNDSMGTPETNYAKGQFGNDLLQ